MSWIVCEFNKGKSAAVTYLCREHETELLCCHLWRKMNDSLYILYGVTVTIAILLRGKRTFPWQISQL